MVGTGTVTIVFFSSSAYHPYPPPHYLLLPRLHCNLVAHCGQRPNTYPLLPGMVFRALFLPLAASSDDEHLTSRLTH